MNNKNELFEYEEEVSYLHVPTFIFIIGFLGIFVIAISVLLFSDYGLSAIPSVLVTILIYVFIIYMIKRYYKNKMTRIMDRKNAIIRNGTKVSGVAKRRNTCLYVTFTNPVTNEEVGFETPALVVKAPRDKIYNCDVYIYGNEYYACNYSEKTN